MEHRANRNTGTCPYHEIGIVRAVRSGEIHPGYTEADERVVERYRKITGCLRHELAKDPQDTCLEPGFHAVRRTYTIRDRILLLQLGSAHLYEETYNHLNRQAEATDRRLRGWRAIVPGAQDISQYARNVDFLLDYEPDRDNSGTNRPEGGNFNLATMFDLQHPSIGRIHPAKLVLAYNPNTAAYTGLTFSVFNPDENGKSSHFYDKMDILVMNGGTTNRLAQLDRKGDVRYRLLLGGADLGTDVDFESTTSFRDFSLFHFTGNNFVTRKTGSIDKERIPGKRTYLNTRSRTLKEADLPIQNGVFVTHYEPLLVHNNGTPYWTDTTEVYIDTENREFGFRQADDSDRRWSISMDLLDSLPLPYQEFRYSGSEEQVKNLFPQLAQTFSDLVYDRFKVTDNSISVV